MVIVNLVNIYQFFFFFVFGNAEYGLGERASTEGDVFSFGVLLLEVVTGKRPTDLDFQQGAGLHEWVKSHYPHKIDDIVDEAMVRYGLSNQTLQKNFLNCNMKLYLSCSSSVSCARSTLHR